MLIRSVLFSFSLISISACSQNESRIYFCDKNGVKQEDIFFNLDQKSLVIRDTFFIGNFTCKKTYKFCFNSPNIKLNIPNNLKEDFYNTSYLLENSKLLWQMKANDKRLSVFFGLNSMAEKYTTCDPL